MTDFILPDIGEGVVECELLAWLVKEGEHVDEDQPVAEVMTDKATVQIPSMHAGVITTLFYQPGDIATVHAPLFAMQRDDHATDSSQPSLTHNEHTAETTPDNEALKQNLERFFLPDIGEGIVECEIIKWHVGEGDVVEEDEVVVDVMTDKAVVEIPAKFAGTITQRFYAEGDTARVHTPLFDIDRALNPEALDGKTKKANSSQCILPVSAQQTSLNTPSFEEGRLAQVNSVPGRIPASPAVRRIARENEIDLHTVNATGKNGRVLKKDISAMLPHCDLKNNRSEANTTPQSQSVRTVSLTPVQRAMAIQMTRSVNAIPHFSVSDELDMDGLINVKNALIDTFNKRSINLSFMPFFIKALSLTLLEYPQFNARLSADQQAIEYVSDHNVGFAIDSPVGLLVPNIKQVQTLSIVEIAQQMQDLINTANHGRLPADTLKEGTITISNVGVLGGTTATPIINYPELAIVALGKIQTLPRFDDLGNVVKASIMPVSWSADHRVIDGASMVRFNNRWLSYLTAPVTMLSTLH